MDSEPKADAAAPEAEAKAKPRKPRAAKLKPVAETKLRDQAQKIAKDATGKARQAANQGIDKAGDVLHDVASTVEDTAAHIDERFGKPYGDYARKAAEGVARAASSVKGKDVEALFVAARDFAKKNPLVAAGAAAAIGFAVTRLLRAGDDDMDLDV